MLVVFLVGLVASALTVAYATWIPFALFIGAFSLAVYINKKDKPLFEKPVSEKRRGNPLEE